MVVFAVTVAAACLVGRTGSVRAQVTEAPKAEIFPDPKKFAYGLFTEGELGTVVVLGPAGDHVRPGWALGLAVGYDLFRWLAVEVRGVSSTHLTKFSDRPQDGELLQLYYVLGGAKLTLRIGHWAIVADGGAGFVHTSTNVLASAGLNESRTSLAAGGGLGVEYHTLSRHFSFGARGTFLTLPKVGQSQAIIATAYVRYAF